MNKDLPNPINVIIYSYKNKNLKNVVANLVERSSKKNKIFVKIFDQSPLTKWDQFGFYNENALEKWEYFENFQDVNYSHIVWDKIKSPCKYKNDIISQSQYSYTLLLSDNIYLSQDWDEYLLKNLKDKQSIISGKNKITLSNDGLFYLKKEEETTDSLNQTYFVSRDLIFGHTSTLQQIGYPWYMKYYGEEETLSLLYYSNHIKVYSCPDSFYNKDEVDTLEYLYTTFSKYHNYNEMIDLFKKQKNKYEDIGKPLMGDAASFFGKHKINIDELNYIPFPLNDVEYDPDASLFTDIDSKKFMTKINYID